MSLSRKRGRKKRGGGGDTKDVLSGTNIKDTNKNNNTNIKRKRKNKNKLKTGLNKTSLTDSRSFFISLFTHMYLVFFISTLHIIEEDLQSHIGLSKSALVNYVAISSIILFILSMTIGWNWPLMSEQVVIIALIWILYSNILSSECICCVNNDDSSMLLSPFIETENPTNPIKKDEEEFIHLSLQNHNKEEEDEGGGEEIDELHMKMDNIASSAISTITSTCSNNMFSIVYSSLFIFILLLSFMTDIIHYKLSLVLRVTSLIVFFILLLIPNNCNQFNFLSIDVLFIKITVYHIIWHTNRCIRMSEALLYIEYHKELYDLDNYRSSSSSTTTTARHHKTIHNSGIYPFKMFKKIREYYKTNDSTTLKLKVCYKANHSVTLPSSSYKILNTENEFYSNSNFIDRNLSWKNRNYDDSYMIVTDLMRTIWILAVCPVFILFAFVELLWMWRIIYMNSIEIAKIHKFKNVEMRNILNNISIV